MLTRIFLSRLLPMATLLLLAVSSLLAQTAADPSGHWEGAVQLPNRELKIEIDLARNSQGVMSGTFGNPAGNMKGFPLATVAVEGRSVRWVLKVGAEVSTFVGTLSADGKSLSGEASQGSESAPFSLTRTGEAKIAAAPKSSPISKEMEGTWNGTLSAGEKQVRLMLKMMNQADGTAVGTIVSQDGSGVEIPITMTQTASHLTVEVPSVGASFVGALNATGTELVGNWKEGSATLPLTFRRAVVTEGKK